MSKIVKLYDDRLGSQVLVQEQVSRLEVSMH